MINRIRELFARGAVDTDRAVRWTTADPAVATAVLLVEAAALDGSIGAAERETIDRILQGRLGLSGEEARSLFDAATRIQDVSNDLVGFTRTLKEAWSHEQRIEMVEMLWEVVYADGIVHDYEANLLRRVGGLIYVSDRERGAARKRVLARMGIATGNQDEATEN
jgi:uncharacterized tellurite resistance protein B-like protein